MLTICSLVAATVLGPQSGIVIRSDVALPYKVEGHGAPVLMLAGGPGFTTDYLQQIIDAVGVDKYGWILLEQRGTPRAKLKEPTRAALEISRYLDDIEALRMQLHLKKWSVVGQSFGSVLAEAYAAAHPDRVTSVVLLDTPGPDLDWLTFADDNVNRSLTEADRAELQEIAKRDRGDRNALLFDSFVASLPGYVYSRDVAMKSKSLFKPGCVDGSTIDLVIANMTREKWNVTKALHRYRGPALVIQGRQDFLGEAAALKAARAMPRGELCFIERAGHLAWLDNPQPFFTRLSSFLHSHAR